MAKVSFAPVHSFPTSSTLLILLVLAFAYASPAAADPIVQFNVRVTSGSFVVLPGEGNECCRLPEQRPRGGIVLRGDGVEVTGSGIAVGPGVGCEFGCAPGTRVNFSIEGNLEHGIVTAPGQFGPIEFDQFGSDGVLGGGSLEFRSPQSFTLPGTSTGSISFRTPFAFAGGAGVPGFLPTTTPDGDPIPANLVFALSGGGTATGTFSLRRENGSDLFFFDNLRFDFAPVPEPSSVMLLITGLTALAARRYSRTSDL